MGAARLARFLGSIGRAGRRSIGGLLALLSPGSDLGRRGEEAAARYLAGRGLRILARNYRSRSGEIDIVAADGRGLVLVEVKSATEGGRDPLWKVDPGKVRRIRRAAARCRRAVGGGFEACRIDAVVVRFRRGPGGRPGAADIRWYPALYPVDGRD
jgi:putative endonuclease